MLLSNFICRAKRFPNPFSLLSSKDIKKQFGNELTSANFFNFLFAIIAFVYILIFTKIKINAK
jgi:hypothetical protein